MRVRRLPDRRNRQNTGGFFSFLTSSLVCSRSTTVSLSIAIAVLTLAVPTRSAEVIDLYDLMADELISGITKEMGKGVPAGTKIAIAPFIGQPIPVAEERAEEMNRSLQAALTRRKD